MTRESCSIMRCRSPFDPIAPRGWIKPVFSMHVSVARAAGAETRRAENWAGICCYHRRRLQNPFSVHVPGRPVDLLRHGDAIRYTIALGGLLGGRLLGLCVPRAGVLHFPAAMGTPTIALVLPPPI